MSLVPKLFAEKKKPSIAVAIKEVIAQAEPNAIRERQKKEKERFELATDSEHWVCFCFESREDKEKFLRHMKLLDLGDKHIDGHIAAKRLGIEIPKRVRKPKKTRIEELVAPELER